MDTEEAIIKIYCCIEEKLKGLKLRTRGFSPKLTDAEVITMEIFGHLKHQNCTSWVYDYMRENWLEWFPNLCSRSSFMKQSKGLSQIKEYLLKELFPCNTILHIIDGLPLPICKYARAGRCKVLNEISGFGFCAAKQEKYFGAKAHIAIDHQGLIKFITLTPANLDEREVLVNLCGVLQGDLLGDKGYISGEKQEILAQNGIKLHTLKRDNMSDNRSKNTKQFIAKTRRYIETIFSVLTDSFHIAQTKAQSLQSYISKIASKILASNFKITLSQN